MAAVGFDQRGSPDLLDPPRSGKAWVKISAAYRVSVSSRPGYGDVALSETRGAEAWLKPAPLV